MRLTCPLLINAFNRFKNITPIRKWERCGVTIIIIKNRLRSTLSDDTMSALMIIAAESDLLRNISNGDIINRMAITNPSFRSQPLLWIRVICDLEIGLQWPQVIIYWLVSFFITLLLSLCSLMMLSAFPFLLSCSWHLHHLILLIYCLVILV